MKKILLIVLAIFLAVPTILLIRIFTYDEAKYSKELIVAAKKLHDREISDYFFASKKDYIKFANEFIKLEDSRIYQVANSGEVLISQPMRSGNKSPIPQNLEWFVNKYIGGNDNSDFLSNFYVICKNGEVWFKYRTDYPMISIVYTQAQRPGMVEYGEEFAREITKIAEGWYIVYYCPIRG